MITTVARTAKSHSPAQLEILKLYRHLLRASNGRDASVRSAIQGMFVGVPVYVVRRSLEPPSFSQSPLSFPPDEFRKNAQIPKKNLLSVEFYTRRAEKQLDLLKSSANVTYHKSSSL
jgi:hypothetical protein